ncbi:hypothetical protein [Terrabacter tumescens]|uniref:hypothetical protein n=1 Tax=Terrabacter tumescens TaxID=60443 RepID=UPI0009E0050F
MHLQNVSWMRSVNNSTNTGTTGRSLRIEAVKIRLLDKILTAHARHCIMSING